MEQQDWRWTSRTINLCEGQSWKPKSTTIEAEEKEGIRICSWNINGLGSKVTDKMMSKYLQHDLILFQETWLEKPYQLSGYKVFHVPATKNTKYGRASGGMAIYNSIVSVARTKVVEVKTENTSAIQILKTDFKTKHDPVKQLVIVNVYLHPREKCAGAKLLTASLAKLWGGANKYLFDIWRLWHALIGIPIWEWCF